jgi:hypothetical protein
MASAAGRSRRSSTIASTKATQSFQKQEATAGAVKRLIKGDSPRSTKQCTAIAQSKRIPTQITFSCYRCGAELVGANSVNSHGCLKGLRSDNLLAPTAFDTGAVAKASGIGNGIVDGHVDGTSPETPVKPVATDVKTTEPLGVGSGVAATLPAGRLPPGTGAAPLIEFAWPATGPVATELSPASRVRRRQGLGRPRTLAQVPPPPRGRLLTKSPFEPALGRGPRPLRPSVD